MNAPRLPRTVWALGAVSFCTDVASEMIVPLLPALLAGLGGTMVHLGLLQGVSEGVVAALKVTSGWWSDRGRRKPWVLAGYGLSTVLRPCFALVTTPLAAVLVRTGDRVGKGLRAAPRDALLVDAVPATLRGAAFGVLRALDHAGAVGGALLASALLAAGVELRTVFALALLPGLAALVVLGFGVQEPARASRPAVAATAAAAAAAAAATAATAASAATAGEHGAVPARSGPGDAAAVRRLVPFLGVVVPSAAGGAVDLFALVRARELGCPDVQLPLLWVVLHVVRSGLAAPCGRWSDHVGRGRPLALGLAAHALVLLAFARVESAVWLWPLFGLLGLHGALTEPAERGWVADHAGANRRGTAFGVYNGAHGIAGLLGPIGLGWLWQHHGAPAAFAAAAATAVVALVWLGGLAALTRRRAAAR